VIRQSESFYLNFAHIKAKPRFSLLFSNPFGGGFSYKMQNRGFMLPTDEKAYGRRRPTDLKVILSHPLNIFFTPIRNLSPGRVEIDPQKMNRAPALRVLFMITLVAYLFDGGCRRLVALQHREW
jgi:hypothetical protein